jgi:thiol-disulfide isomerase/thioredoxin
MRAPRPARRLRSFGVTLALGIAACASLAVLSSSPHASAQTVVPKKVPGWLGITMEPSKGTAGVNIVHVVRGSPADKAGVVDKDRVTKVDGSSVSSPGEVSAVVATKGPGKTVQIDVARAGKTVSFTVTLVPKPPPEQIMRMELVGQKLPTLPALKLASGTGPIAYPFLTGKVVLIDLFATWCGPCLQLGPYYQAMHAKYYPQGLIVLGISDEDTGLLAGWSAKNSVGYTIASDPTNSAFTRYSAPALPSSLLVDKYGVVRDVTVGFELGQVKRTEQLIQVLLKEP